MYCCFVQKSDAFASTSCESSQFPSFSSRSLFEMLPSAKKRWQMTFSALSICSFNSTETQNVSGFVRMPHYWECTNSPQLNNSWRLPALTLLTKLQRYEEWPPPVAASKSFLSGSFFFSNFPASYCSSITWQQFRLLKPLCFSAISLSSLDIFLS